MKNKPVSFNLDADTEKKLFEFAQQQINFSKYVKGLIWTDMNRKNHEVIKTVSGGIKITRNS